MPPLLDGTPCDTNQPGENLMPVEKGWFIKMKEPNNIFWTLNTDDNYTRDMSNALLFARKKDAEAYFDCCFHKNVQNQFTIGGVN
jgi:hypothetical protein